MTKVRSHKYIPCRSWSLAVTSASVSESGTLERPCFFPSIHIPRAIFSSDSLPLVLRLRSFQDKSRGTGCRSLIDADYPLPILRGNTILPPPLYDNSRRLCYALRGTVFPIYYWNWNCPDLKRMDNYIDKDLTSGIVETV